MNRRLWLVVRGRVQGVGFRWHVCETARDLGLTGWVRNCADGSVEAVAEGPEERLAQLADACREGPSSLARVRDVHAQYAPASGEFNAYRIEYGP